MKFKFSKKNLAGTVIGFIMPVLILPLTVYILGIVQKYPFQVLWNKLVENPMVLSKFLSLSIIPNLIWFYFFLNRDRYELARGIIIGSALHFPFIVCVNLIR